MRLSALGARIGLGLMLLAGLGFALGGASWLELGTLRRMGPGYFPMLVGLCLALLAVLALALERRDPPPAEAGDPGAALAVAGSIAAFALGAVLLGVIPAAALSVVIASLIAPQLTLVQRAALGGIVAFGVWLVFIVALDMPLVAVRGL